MAKPSKKKITEALNEWAELHAQKAEKEQALNDLLAPIKAEYDKVAGPLIQANDELVKPLAARMQALFEQIEAQLKDGIGDDGSIALPQVVGDAAIAEVNASITREIKPEDFFNAVPEASRESGFYSCVKILVQQVDKKFGDAMEYLMGKKVTHRVTVRLKNKGE
ncbi:MAG: hypothetical protein AB7O81_30290 [Blastocatellales bacterium]